MSGLDPTDMQFELSDQPVVIGPLLADALAEALLSTVDPDDED
jgi:hypothetical protein